MNKLGPVDVFVVSHHGWIQSNSAPLVNGIASRVAIMDNGAAKGGSPPVWDVVSKAPGLEDLWQLHVSQLSGQEYTVAGMFIANLDPQSSVPVAALAPPQPGAAPLPPPRLHDGSANWVKVSAREDGTFTVSNSRNGFSKTYR